MLADPQPPLPLGGDPHDTRLRDLADQAFTTIAVRLSEGEPPAEAIPTVLHDLFLGPPSTALDLADPPGHSAQLTLPDPATLTHRILAILTPDG